MKPRTQYVCQSCGTSSAKWLGRCSGCGEWNTLVEEVQARSSGTATRLEKSQWVSLENASALGSLKRVSTGIAELDRVLGGGLVADGFALVGGDPGVGKSTLLLQMLGGLAQNGVKALYLSGEESVDQIRGRAERLGVRSSERIFLSAETNLENALESIAELKPGVVVLDSLQTFSSSALESAPGSVSQVREIASRLMQVAKTGGTAVVLVGHVTKDGSLAGPKVVEHLVDTVLYFEGDSTRNYRLLRTVKNRFGSSMGLGVFEMRSSGLVEITNPSGLFLEERSVGASGTAVTATMEGTRPMLVELQALVTYSGLSIPRRTAVGLESSRLLLLCAVLERHCRVALSDQDVYFNVAGGFRLSDPACDLATGAAIWSSRREIALPADWFFLGEVGLTGEIRRVSQPEPRLLEAKRLGFSTAVIPGRQRSEVTASGIKLVGLNRLQDLGDALGSAITASVSQ